MTKYIKHWNEIKPATSDPWNISELEKDDNAPSQDSLPDTSRSDQYFLRDRRT